MLADKTDMENKLNTLQEELTVLRIRAVERR